MTKWFRSQKKVVKTDDGSRSRSRRTVVPRTYHGGCEEAVVWRKIKEHSRKQQYEILPTVWIRR